MCVSRLLAWIRLDVAHLVEIFRDEKLLEGEQTGFKSNNHADVAAHPKADTQSRGGFTHHHGAVVLTDEDASAVVVVRHAGARS